MRHQDPYDTPMTVRDKLWVSAATFVTAGLLTGGVVALLGPLATGVVPLIGLGCYAVTIALFWLDRLPPL